MELFHVLNRGVDKRSIVLDEQDRNRFVKNLSVMNDKNPVLNLGYTLNNIDIRRRYNKAGAKQEESKDTREKLVDIHGWCLMNNHYHLLVSEKIEGGLSMFLKKLNMGYAKYFNERYDRDGALFQGKTKKKHIDNDAYFLYILHYIHLNPLDYLKNASEWRTRKITNSAHVIEYLEKYRWSSFQDYCGGHNFPAIISTELFNDVFRNYKKELLSYVRDIDSMQDKADIMFE